MKPTETTDSDNWPVFLLKDAVVYRKSKDGQLSIANVCNVDTEGPFLVRGQLDIDLSDFDQRKCSTRVLVEFFRISSSMCFAN